MDEISDSYLMDVGIDQILARSTFVVPAAENGIKIPITQN